MSKKAVSVFEHEDMVQAHYTELSDVLIQQRIKEKRKQYGKEPWMMLYHEARRLHQDIINRMCEAYNKQQESYDERLSNALDKAQLQEDLQFDFEDKRELQFFMDMIVYKYSQSPCMCEDFKVHTRIRAERKKEMLESMLQSFTSIFQIKEVNEPLCYVMVEDLFTHKVYKLMDESLVLNPFIEKKLLYLRLIPYKDFYFQTGLVVEIAKDDSWMRRYMKRNKGKYRPLALHIAIFQHYIEASL